MRGLFLSYARADDEDFVRWLYNALTAEGFTVWFDRMSMPSRSLTFLHEIRAAIDGIDRFLAVVGPAALKSEYVRAEGSTRWQQRRSLYRSCAAASTPIYRPNYAVFMWSTSDRR